MNDRATLTKAAAADYPVKDDKDTNHKKCCPFTTNWRAGNVACWLSSVSWQHIEKQNAKMFIDNEKRFCSLRPKFSWYIYFFAERHVRAPA